MCAAGRWIAKMVCAPFEWARAMCCRICGRRTVTKKERSARGGVQGTLALWVVIFSGAMVVALAAYIIGLAGKGDIGTAKEIFNIVLPVLATWVGTVLAFYFGRENFESANREVREMVDKLTPGQKAKAAISTIMRDVVRTTCFRLSAERTEDTAKVKELRELFGRAGVTRVPVLAEDGKAKYMIHESTVSKYLADDAHSEGDPLRDLVAAHDDLVSLNKGFIVVSEAMSIATAKVKMEQTASCQDIFVTAKGTADEPLLGWVSNVRLGKHLEA